MKIRYDTPDEHGVSRRERNEKFEIESPMLLVSDEGRYIWEWYEQLSSGVRRVQDGVCFPIAWTEIIAWVQVTGHIVWPREYAILRAMDAAFCSEMNSELSDFRERRGAEQKKEAEKNASKGGRRRR